MRLKNGMRQNEEYKVKYRQENGGSGCASEIGKLAHKKKTHIYECVREWSSPMC